MDITTVGQLIGSVGFPVAMCLILCWYVKYMTDQHKQEVDALKISLDNNTKILTELFTFIKGAGNGQTGD